MVVKVKCPTCDKEMKERNLKYHQCDRSIPAAVLREAWIGDSEHRTAVIRWLLSLGYDQTVSHTLLTSYVCAEHQVAYLEAVHGIPKEYERASLHNKAQIFEAAYSADQTFRENYNATVLPSPATNTTFISYITMPWSEYKKKFSLTHLPGEDHLIFRSTEVKSLVVSGTITILGL